MLREERWRHSQQSIHFALIHADLASIADGTHDMLLFRKIVTAQYAMEGNLWESVSSEAKDLVRNLLQIDVEARYTTSQVLESAFIRRHCEP